jgi:hypothetical protein
MKNSKVVLVGLAGTLVTSALVSFAPSANAQFNGSLNNNTLRFRLNSPNNTATTTNTNNNGSAQGNTNTSSVTASPTQINAAVLFGTANGGAQNAGGVGTAPTQMNGNQTTQGNTTNQN